MQVRPERVKIRSRGLRPGEKLDEDLFSKTEGGVAPGHPKIMATVPRPLPADFADRIDALLFAAGANRPPHEIKRFVSFVLPDYHAAVEPAIANGSFAYPYPDDF